MLVADDNASIRRVECHLLKEAGFATVEARNGQHVVDILEKEKFDVVLLDIMMPVLDGFAVCKMIKAEARWSQTVVIMVSAKDNKDDVIRARMVGADDYILKPFKNNVVVERIRRALSNRALRTPRGLKIPERRQAPRVSLPGTVRWTTGGASVYEGKLLNLSTKGFAIEFGRCATCTGYQKDTVHPMCLLAPIGQAIPASSPAAFALELAPDRTISAEGKVLHVYQAEDGVTEVVGFAFTEIPDEVRKTIEVLAR